MRRQTRDIRVSQGAVGQAVNKDPMRYPFFARVTNTHADRMTCDIETVDKYVLINVPVLTKAGTVDEAPYGVMSLPVIDDWVLVIHAGPHARQEIIIGTFIPYLERSFNEAPVNSSSKAYSTALLEAGKELHDRYIFKSGASVEVEEDGSIVIETPSGAYVRIDETTNEILVVDQYDNKVTMDSSGMKLEDKNGNDITMGATVTINGNLEVLQ